ncbi:serine/threonine-protein kinase [Nocardioides stalactiti]|uniref:serine/threonine-protein kinase n=1 Tax=Nocardioides stalactiti TaxID=2755356 RepID=UPI0016043F7C|nr:serine/threonine-protein kinase [Nocardioides stalactiti]
MSSIRVADRYALGREIGRGASGAVWEARDEVLGRVVALKRIGLPAGASSYDLERAEREARLAARVNHPNVIAVYDFVADRDHHWLVTEYVDGTDLASVIRERGRFSADEAAPLLLQAAEALAAAHRLDIVHRDVKPSNILIARDGQVKLSDFGIARAIADASLTQTGLVTGSPAYLAPEVATGGSGTPASDVWAFGTTIFHLLAGQPPYATTGDSAVLGTLYRIAHDPPPRLADAGWLGPLLEATMDKDPARRPTMDDVVTYLRARPAMPPIAASQPLPGPGTTATATAAMLPVPPAPPAIPAARPSTRSADPLRIAAIGVAAVIVLAVIGVLLLNAGDDTDRSATPEDSTSQTDGADGSDAPTQDLPTTEELEAFATTYVETAADDPAAGFALLTPSYQQRSPGYAEFWGTIKKPEILDVSADPAGMTVTYTYRYQQKKVGNREETVTLRVVREGDGFLIDDAVSSG